jgi:outer membrane lipoprotein-sorting protein
MIGAAVAGLGLLPPVRAAADAQADALLAKVRAKYAAATSLGASVTVTDRESGRTFTQTGSLQLRKPNFARIQMAAPHYKLKIMSDGKTAYVLLPNNQYSKREIDEELAKGGEVVGLTEAFFFGHDKYGPAKLSDAGVQKSYAGKTSVGKSLYDVVTLRSRAIVPYTLKLFISSDGLLGRTVLETGTPSKLAVETIEWKGQKLNALPASTSFAVALPRDATEYKPPSEDEFEAKLVPVGKPAPAFELPSPAGGTVSLKGAEANHKAVMVNFWFYT